MLRRERQRPRKRLGKEAEERITEILNSNPIMAKLHAAELDRLRFFLGTSHTGVRFAAHLPHHLIAPGSVSFR
jgi:hypothetical protein